MHKAQPSVRSTPSRPILPIIPPDNHNLVVVNAITHLYAAVSARGHPAIETIPVGTDAARRHAAHCLVAHLSPSAPPQRAAAP